MSVINYTENPVIKISFNNSIAFYYQGKSILYNHNISINRSKITLNDNLISVYEEDNKKQLFSWNIYPASDSACPVKKLTSLIQVN